MERGGRGGGGHHQLWPAAQNSASFIVESHDSKSPCIPLPRSPPCLFFPRRFFPPAPILFLLSPFLPFSRLPLHRLLRNGLVLRASFHATQAVDAMWIRNGARLISYSFPYSFPHATLPYLLHRTSVVETRLRLFTILPHVSYRYTLFARNRDLLSLEYLLKGQVVNCKLYLIIIIKIERAVSIEYACICM